jgi:hypothetical protein
VIPSVITCRILLNSPLIIAEHKTISVPRNESQPSGVRYHINGEIPVLIMLNGTK